MGRLKFCGILRQMKKACGIFTLNIDTRHRSFLAWRKATTWGTQTDGVISPKRDLAVEIIDFCLNLATIKRKKLAPEHPIVDGQKRLGLSSRTMVDWTGFKFFAWKIFLPFIFFRSLKGGSLLAQGYSHEVEYPLWDICRRKFSRT